MLYSEIIAVCSEIQTKHINTLCGQNEEFVIVKRGGTYSNHWALKSSPEDKYFCCINKVITIFVYSWGETTI
jgi:thiamine biosynthesis protein ThiC